ncbi:MAG: aldo/keto reductase [bacterium]|nr:aldo/keto reductase [bacterium]
MKIPSPLLGMGTWGMGGKFERDDKTVDASLQVLRLGLSLGLHIIDTAEIYGEGLTEEIVGEAIQGHPREDVFIISKVWKTNLHYDDVLYAAEKTLGRLKTPYIDLYLVHWPNHEIPIQETMRAMEKLRKDGLVKAIGVSNFSLSEMREAQKLLTSATLTANQIEYSVLHQEAQKEILPYCSAHNIRVIAYRPLAKGKIAETQLPALRALARTYNKTVNQIALNWLLSQNIIAIPATLNPEHLRENVGALDFTLSAEDIRLLTSV